MSDDDASALDDLDVPVENVPAEDAGRQDSSTFEEDGATTSGDGGASPKKSRGGAWPTPHANPFVLQNACGTRCLAAS